MRLKQRDKDAQNFGCVANSIVDNHNRTLKLLLHGVFYVNAHLLVGHNGTTLLPHHKLHLNIKYTTLSLTMIIKQPLNRTGSSASRRHRVGAWALAHGSRNRQLTVRMPAMQVPPGLALRTSRGRRIRLPRRLNRHL